jgi:hypothetical protein
MRRSSVHLIPEDQAQGAADRVFAKAKQALGVSFAPEVLRAYAAVPGFLDFMWETVEPVLQERDFLRKSDRLRAQAYTEAFNYLTVPEINADSDATSTIDGFHCAAPRLLLLTSIVLRALEEPIGRAREAEEARLPACPCGAVIPQESRVSTPAREIFENYKAVRSTKLVNCWMLALSPWPEFLRNYWKAIRSLASSAVYDRIVLELRETAFTFAEDIPVEIDLTHERLADVGLTPDAIAEIGRITDIFALEYGPMVLDVEIARIGCERARRIEASAPQAAA